MFSSISSCGTCLFGRGPCLAAFLFVAHQDLLYVHPRAANTDMLARTRARKHLWTAMAMLVSIGQSILSIS